MNTKAVGLPARPALPRSVCAVIESVVRLGVNLAHFAPIPWHINSLEPFSDVPFTKRLLGVHHDFLPLQSVHRTLIASSPVVHQRRQQTLCAFAPSLCCR
jgi:hypothetical protein